LKIDPSPGFHSNKEKISKNNLPDSIPALMEFVLIGREKLNAYKAKVRMIKNIKLSKAVKDQAVKESQEMGEAVLLAEAKMGELLKKIDTRPRKEDVRRRHVIVNDMPSSLLPPFVMAKGKDFLSKGRDTFCPTCPRSLRIGP